MPDPLKPVGPVADVVRDVTQPLAKELGKLLALPLQLVNAKLLPTYSRIYSAEAIARETEQWIAEHFRDRLDDMMEPPLSVSGPTLQAIVFSGESDTIRHLFLQLLCTSMDRTAAGIVHPSYVEVIKQLTPDEARLVSVFGQSWTIDSWQVEVEKHAWKDQLGFIERGPVYKRLTVVQNDVELDFPGNVPKYIDNLLRLKIVYETRKWPHHVANEAALNGPFVDQTYPSGPIYYGGKRFGELKDLYPQLVDHARECRPEEHCDCLQVWHSTLRLSSYGKDLLRACLGVEPAPRPEDEAETALAEEL